MANKNLRYPNSSRANSLCSDTQKEMYLEHKSCAPERFLRTCYCLPLVVLSAYNIHLPGFCNARMRNAQSKLRYRE